MNVKCWSFVVIFFLLLSPVIAGLGSGGTDEEKNIFNPQSFDWSSGDYSKISDWSVVNPSFIVRWDDVPVTAYDSMDFSSGQEKVPVTKIDKIPKDKVDVLKVKFPSKLTSEQLLYNKNLNKFSDVKSLDSQVVNDVISQFSKTSILLQAGDSGTKVTLKDGGIVEIDKGSTLSLGDNINNVGIAGFTGARYDGKILTAQSGSWATQKKNDEVLTTTQNFQKGL